MRRFAFNVFAIFSLLVFVLSLGIWAHSYFVGESIQWQRARADSTQQPAMTQFVVYRMDWVRGVIGITRLRSDDLDRTTDPDGWQYRQSGPEKLFFPARSRDDRVYLRLGNFGLRHMFASSGTEWTSLQTLAVPLWLFLPAALPPLLWLRRRRRTLGRGFPVTPTAPRAAN